MLVEMTRLRPLIGWAMLAMVNHVIRPNLGRVGNNE